MEGRPYNLMARELKPEQAVAVETLGAHVSVTAGPGAGKTTVLVERYLHILRSNPTLNIDQIVAITFTNRAANEMRERLRKRLDELLADVPAEERRRWMNYKRTLDGAIITTIHGFCSRLLREFPVEARIDPQFVLLDEHQAATLLENAVEEALTEFINAGHEAVSRLTAGVGRSRLAAALVELYKSIRNQGLVAANLIQQAANSHSSWDEYLLAVAEVDARVTDLINTSNLRGKAEEKRFQLQREWPRIRQLLFEEDVPLPDYCREIGELRETARPDARGSIGPLVQTIDELFWGGKAKSYGLAPSLRFDIVAREYACEALQVIASIDERLDQMKRQLAALDFDDLQLRALKLLEQPEVLLRAARRYKFFLIDEFQDTNPLQRDLLDRLALAKRKDSNLFIVGDPKQSVYGFRGADVGVFSEMTEALLKAAGAKLPLRTNFRSQPPLISFFNLLFSRLFKPDEEIKPDDLPQLGYVEHEPSLPERVQETEGPLVELLVDTITSDNEEWKARLTTRERDAQQLAHRINALVTAGSADVPPAKSTASNESKEDPGTLAVDAFNVVAGEDARAPGERLEFHNIEFRNIALLFRAMTDVPIYESVFRRADIPYQTILGKGFYEREEITDLIQLLRFLDNRTDELALAAVLRSPLCGVSDNALLALRLGPKAGETPTDEAPAARRSPRRLFSALRQQAEIDFISDDERAALDRAAKFLQSLIEKRNRYPVGDLLRFAVRSSEYSSVIAANFDGAQKLANVEKLFTLAERFERSGAHLIRDFVKYVRDFESIGSRESEGQLDEAANAVTFMTIHQAKGLEYPVVIIPDLQRISGPKDNWFLLDRYLGLTLKVPDGRGDQVMGGTFKQFSDRARQRELFESLRLLYVAATRAQDRLILSGAADELNKLNAGRDCWLKWIWQGLELENARRSETINLAPDVQVHFALNLTDESRDIPKPESVRLVESASAIDLDQPAGLFPLLAPVERIIDPLVPRFSVTQLINYRRCPRQYYFDRVLHIPSADAVAAWNDAEVPEPPGNLTATLKGAVMHRFCETYATGDDADACLRQSFAEVLRTRQSQFADRLLEINSEKAIEELWPLAQNYLGSEVFRRIEHVRVAVGGKVRRFPEDQAGPDDPVEKPTGLWSELGFRLRRPKGLITGTIDKLLISPATDGDGFEVEIIDFKTNRFRMIKIDENNDDQSAIEADKNDSDIRALTKHRGSKPRKLVDQAQFSFDFNNAAGRNIGAGGNVASEGEIASGANLQVGKGGLPPLDIMDQVRTTAADYELQMQAYALAVRQLIPNLTSKGKIKVTLHFMQPDVEFHLSEALLEQDACAVALDEAMLEIVSSSEPVEFPVYPAVHCRMCNFLEACPAGRDFVGASLRGRPSSPNELLDVDRGAPTE